MAATRSPVPERDTEFEANRPIVVTSAPERVDGLIKALVESELIPPCLGEQLRQRLGKEGVRPFHAEQIAAWLYQRGVEDLDAMTDLSRDVRQRLATEWELSALEFEDVVHSTDGTVKAALRASDGADLGVWDCGVGYGPDGGQRQDACNYYATQSHSS